jgi:hypothetical protein
MKGEPDMTDDRTACIHGLRDLADFLDSNPVIPDTADE